LLPSPPGIETTGYDSHPHENHHLHRVENQGYRSQAFSHGRSHEGHVGQPETVLPLGPELALQLALPSEQESVLSPEQEQEQELTLLQVREPGYLPVMTKMEAREQKAAVDLPYP